MNHTRRRFKSIPVIVSSATISSCECSLLGLSAIVDEPAKHPVCPCHPFLYPESLYPESLYPESERAQTVPPAHETLAVLADPGIFWLSAASAHLERPLKPGSRLDRQRTPAVQCVPATVRSGGRPAAICVVRPATSAERDKPPVDIYPSHTAHSTQLQRGSYSAGRFDGGQST
jgi:hypothetical protein